MITVAFCAEAGWDSRQQTRSAAEVEMVLMWLSPWVPRGHHRATRLNNQTIAPQPLGRLTIRAGYPDAAGTQRDRFAAPRRVIVTRASGPCRPTRDSVTPSA